VVLFEKFAEEFFDLGFGRTQRSPPGSGGAIHTALGLPVPHLAGDEITLLFQSVQDRIQRAGAQFVSMPAQFFDHRQAVKRFFSRVVQDMQPDQASIQFSIIHSDCSVQIC